MVNKTKVELIEEVKRLQEKIRVLEGPSVKNNRDTRETYGMNEFLHGEERFRNYIENAPYGVFIVDEKGRYREVNKTASSITGYSRDELLRMHILDLIPEPYHDQANKHFESVITDGVANTDIPYKKKDGSLKYWSVRAVKLSSKLFMGYVNDITDSTRSLKKIKESENKFRSLVEQVSEMLFLHDQEGWIKDINKTAENTTGYTREELLKMNVVDIDPDAADRKDMEKFWKKIKPHDQLNAIEVRHRRKDGKIYQAEVSMTKIVLSDGLYILALARDITERKKAEREILKFRTISDRALHGHSIIDMDGKIIYVNESFASVHGYTMKELIGKHISVFHTKEQMETVRKMNKDLQKYGSFEMSEVWHIRKDGTKFPMLMSGIIIRDENNNPQYMAGTAIDISARKEFEQALLNRKIELEQIFEAIPDALVYTDQKRKIIKVNAAFEKIYGYKPEEVLGKPTEMLYARKEDYMEQGKLRFNVQSRDVYSPYEVSYKRKSGEIFPSEGVGTPVRDSQDNVIGFLGLVRDITERKQAEEKLNELNNKLAAQNEEYAALNEELQQINEELRKARDKAEESDRLKTAFLANMSHEIRTPMNGILGFLDLLKKPELDGDKQQKYIDIIKKSGDRMLNTVNNIIEISKIETGQVCPNLSEMNINEQIEYLYDFFKPEAEKKGLTIHFDTSLTSKDAVIMTDKIMLNSILTNLIKNALKYTESGSIKFGYTQEGHALNFYVKDTGIGIPAQMIQNVFNRFVQADLEDKKALEGAGLGLAIVKAYVQLLNGRIWVESIEGKGSGFYFSLPYNKFNSVRLKPEHEPPTKKLKEENKKLKILIAEDDSISEMHLSILLEEMEYELIHARTGKEAVEACHGNPDLDLVLMDVRMPKMDGYKATKEIRKFFPDLVIIAQTAYALPNEKEKALKAGCNDYISKPIQEHDLIKVIHRNIP